MKKKNNKVKISIRPKYLLEDKPKKKEEDPGPNFTDYFEYTNKKTSRKPSKKSEKDRLEDIKNVRTEVENKEQDKDMDTELE